MACAATTLISELSSSPCLPQTVADKTAYALSKGLGVILCCGETLDERESNDTFNVIAKQVHTIVGAWLGSGLVSVLCRAQSRTWPSRACQGHKDWRGSQLKDAASCCRIGTQVLCRAHNVELQCIRCALHACPNGPGGYEASGLGKLNTGGQRLAESSMAA